MKKNKVNKVIEIVVPILCLIGSLIYCFITKEYKFLITVIIVGAGIGLLYFLVIVLLGLNKVLDKKFKKKINVLMDKTDRTVYEECYVLGYQEKFDNVIKQFIEKEKIKGINNIYAESLINDQIIIGFKYKGFDAAIGIEENKSYYIIDSPSRYDGIKNNKRFEQKKDLKLSCRDYDNLDDFIYMIVLCIKSVIEEIDSFMDVNLVDNLFNGRLLEKNRIYFSELKKEGWLLTIVGVVFFAFFTFLLVHDFITLKNITSTITASILVLLIFVPCIYFGIKFLCRIRNYKHDYETKSYCVINEKPYKIKIRKDKLSKYSNWYVREVVLYFKNVKLILIVGDNSIKNHKSIRICKKECLEIQTELKYLTKSKIIIDGADKYISTIRKHLLK